MVVIFFGDRTVAGGLPTFRFPLLSLFLFYLLPWLGSPSSTVPEGKPSPSCSNSPTDSVAPYPFIDLSRNVILHPEALQSFFDRLHQLETGAVQQVRIVHIGDSHIQADLLTGHLRALLQERFGSAGRGVVFPFSLAHSHNAVDLNVSSPYSWENRRSIYDPADIPLGICGITLQTHSPGVFFQLALRPPADTLIDYAFDRITLFYESGNGFLPFFPLAPDSIRQEGVPPAGPAAVRRHVVKAGDTLYGISRQYGCTVADIQHWNGLRSSRINIGQRLIVGRLVPPKEESGQGAPLSPDRILPAGASFSLPRLSRQLTIKTGGAGISNGKGILYGLLLENTGQAGIIYHAIGVNGVTYRHYNQAERFWAQLPSLQPDLIIVSLGTNEALGSSFLENEFQKEVAAFLQQTVQWVPGCAVLLTTNPDVLRRRRYNHPANLQVQKVILEGAAAKSTAAWDLHEVMGGHGSIRKWRACQLAGADYIHFTKEGYRLQARLLFEALMTAYAARD